MYVRRLVITQRVTMLQSIVILFIFQHHHNIIIICMYLRKYNHTNLFFLHTCYICKYVIPK